MSRLTFEINRYQCSIELTIEQFKKLEEIDYLDVVMPMLEKIGASDIEYYGHFGAAVFFTCEDIQSAQKVTQAIEELVQ